MTVIGAPLPLPPGWPQPLGDEAMQGLIGALVRRLAPGTECDPASLWLHLVTGVGNMIGHSPYVEVEGGRTHLNIYGVVVGDTSRARKGTSWRATKAPLVEMADIAWLAPGGGLSSAEGLIERLSDPDAPTLGGAAKKGEPLAGRSWFAVEQELSTLWKRSKFDGSTILEALRELYDSGDYAVHRRDGVAITGAHLSLVGHTTREELLECMAQVNLHNGVANRFAWFAVRRVRNLPLGGPRTDVADLIDDIRNAVRHARNLGEIRLTRAARELYQHVYEDLVTDIPGLVGRITARTEHHPIRIAAILAALDAGRTGTPAVIRMEHLLAGLEATRYCGDSVNWIFGGCSENPAAAKLLELIRAAPAGLSRTEIYRKSGNNPRADEINAAVEYLTKRGICVEETQRRETAGAPQKVLRLHPENPDGRIPMARPWAAAMAKAFEFIGSCRVDDVDPWEPTL